MKTSNMKTIIGDCPVVQGFEEESLEILKTMIISLSPLSNTYLGNSLEFTFFHVVS